MVDDDEPSGLLTVVEMEKMKVLELRNALKDRVLSSKGKKNELRIRLEESIGRNAPIFEQLSEAEEANVSGDGFDNGTYWELLEQDG